MDLIKRVAEIQAQHGLSDRRFASLIGISHAHWSSLKKGRFPVHYSLLVAAIGLAESEHCPELREGVIDHLEMVARRNPIHLAGREAYATAL